MDEWTWRDTLDRIQHLDLVISETIREGILIVTGILAIVSSTFIYLSSHSESQYKILFSIIVLICILGILVILVIIANLARQEYLRQWYNSLIDNFNLTNTNPIPLFPRCKKWSPRKRKLLSKIGNKIGGYFGFVCLWIIVFCFVIAIFLGISIIAYISMS